MSDYEREDMELAAMMGSKFQSATEAPVKAETEKASENTTATKKSCHRAASEAKDAIWSPFDAEPSFTQKLWDTAKWTLVFAGLTSLFFYWQQTGQMQPSAAVPCMCACTAMVGWAIGKNVGGKV